MKKICKFTGLFVSAMFLFLVSEAMAGGIPAAAIVEQDDSVSVITINFDSNYTLTEVNQLYTVISALLTSFNSYDVDITPIPPSTLMQYGDGDYIHGVVLGVLSQLSSYLQIKATKVNGPTGKNLRFDMWLWNSDSTSMYLGAFEIPETLVALLTSGDYSSLF